MLKTNSKQAINNIWEYLEGFIDIINDELVAYNPEWNYLTKGNIEKNNREALATVIYKEFIIEKVKEDNQYKAGRISKQELFEEWAQGLAMCGIFDYYLYRENDNPREILGNILEETEEEKNRYTEDQAAERLTQLIYREVLKYRA